MRLLWWLPTAAILGLMALGAGGASLRLLGPGPGFRLFGLGIVIAATSALLLSAAGALASARGSSWRGDAIRGAALPVIISVILLVLIATGGSHPIHNVTTDRSIGFAPEILELRPGEDLVAALEQQAESYPDIAPLELPLLARGEAFQIALQAAHDMPGWVVTASDPKWGRIYATAESRIFHFVDDVSILVEHRTLGGSLVQMRSRSRIGQSDLGANAARIRAYQAAVREAARASG